MSININPIETYVPTIYVNNSEPDLDETNLNHAEQALKRVTDAANAAILALESLDSAKIDAAKIVNNLLATDTSTVLSGPMGKALGDRLTAAENLLTKLNGEMFTNNCRIINSAPEGSRAFIFTVSSGFNITSSLQITTYSKGIYIPYGKDALMLAADYTRSLFVAFRNNEIWEARTL